MRHTLCVVALLAAFTSPAHSQPAAQPATQPLASEPTPPAASPAAKAQGASNPAAVPEDRLDREGWAQRQETIKKRVESAAADGSCRVIFVGDSITEQWEGPGRKVWDERYAPLGAVNMGIGGDFTTHVLWRLDHSSLEKLAKPQKGEAPRVAVVLIGTNNFRAHSAEQIAGGIKAVVAKLREKLPATKVVLLSILPRGEKPDEMREKLAAASTAAAAIADGKDVIPLDIGKALTRADGTIDKAIMPDFLHLSEDGYRRWADELDKVLKPLLQPASTGTQGETPKKSDK